MARSKPPKSASPKTGPTKKTATGKAPRNGLASRKAGSKKPPAAAHLAASAPGKTDTASTPPTTSKAAPAHRKAKAPKPPASAAKPKTRSKASTRRVASAVATATALTTYALTPYGCTKYQNGDFAGFGNDEIAVAGVLAAPDTQPCSRRLDRNQIAQEAGLSYSAVGRAINTLVGSGWVC